MIGGWRELVGYNPALLRTGVDVCLVNVQKTIAFLGYLDLTENMVNAVLCVWGLKEGMQLYPENCNSIHTSLGQ